MDLVEKLLHGSPSRPEDFRLASKSNGIEALGPGLYCTKDPLVAGCYSRNGGTIFEIHLRGLAGLVLDLDASLSKQAPECRQALLRLPFWIGVDVHKHAATDKPLRDVLEAVNPAPLGHTQDLWVEVSREIKAAGIWMMHGHLSGMSSSGLMDRGVQYVILDKARVEKVSVYTPPAAAPRGDLTLDYERSPGPEFR